MATDTLTDDFRNFLTTCPRVTADQIVNVLLQRAARAVPDAAPGMNATRPAVVKTGKRRQKKARSEVPAAGPKRPLNSWMAFRKYYSASLAPHTQRAISKVLVAFWHEDPFEAKWAMLAKAYSIVRGTREKKEAPLDDFFTHCADLVGIIPPNEYQQWMGWQVLPSQTDPNVLECTRLFNPDLSTFPGKFTTTTLGVDDLVSHCYAVGYVAASNDNSQDSSNQGSLTMVSMPATLSAGITNGMTSSAPPTAPPKSDEVDVNGHAEEELRQALTQDLTGSRSLSTNIAVPPSAGQAVLLRADEEMERLKVSTGEAVPWPFFADPGQTSFVSYDPAAQDITVEDGGRWDGFTPEQASLLGLDLPGLGMAWDEYVNWARGPD